MSLSNSRQQPLTAKGGYSKQPSVFILSVCLIYNADPVSDVISERKMGSELCKQAHLTKLASVQDCTCRKIAYTYKRTLLCAGYCIYSVVLTVQIVDFDL